MKSIILSSKFLFISLMFLPLAMCSSDDGDNDDEQNQQNEVMASTNAPTNLFMANMTMSGPGNTAGIYGCWKLPWHGEQFHRMRLNLTDETFFAIYGLNYNTDNTVLTEFGSFNNPGSESGRNRLSLTFIFADEANANAELKIHKGIVSEINGTPSFSCGDTSQKIFQFDCEFIPLEQNSNILGGYESVKYSNENIPLDEMNNIYIKGTNGDSNPSFSTFIDALDEDNTTIYVKIIETLIVENQVRTLIDPE